MNKLQLLQLSKSVPIDLIHLKKNGFFLFSPKTAFPAEFQSR